LEAYENHVGNCVSKSNQKFVKEQRTDGDRLSGGKYLIGGFLVDLINAIATNLRYVLTKWETTHQNRIDSKQKKYFFYLFKGLGASTGTDYKVTVNERQSFKINPPLQAGCITGTFIIVLLKKGGSLLSLIFLKLFLP
jgi:hypothetical protein